MGRLVANAACVIALLAFAACGGGDGDGDPSTTDAGPDQVQVVCECNGATCGVDNCGGACGSSCGADEICRAGSCEAPKFCTIGGFSATQQAATARITEVGTAVRYEAQGGDTFDRLVIETRRGEGHDGPTQPGLYEVGEAGVECDLCVTAYQECVDGECLKVFTAREGTAYIGGLGGDGASFTGSLHGLVLEQAFIEPKTGEAFPMPAGDVICVDEVAFDQATDNVEIHGHCEEKGTGDKLGDLIRNFELPNADGDFVPLHDVCGSKAVLVVAVAGYCGACESFVPEAKALYDKHKADGMELMVVVGEDTNSVPATLQYCQAYADGKKLPHELVYCDGGESNGWSTLFANIDTYAAGTIGLPFTALLYGDTMEYVWHNQGTSTEMEDELQALLDR